MLWNLFNIIFRPKKNKILFYVFDQVGHEVLSFYKGGVPHMFLFQHKTHNFVHFTIKIEQLIFVLANEPSRMLVIFNFIMAHRSHGPKSVTGCYNKHIYALGHISGSLLNFGGEQSSVE